MESCFKKFINRFNLEPRNIRGAFIPAQLPGRTYFDNILLVGDAACLTDPFLQGGINGAIVSGYLAAKTAEEALRKDRFDALFLKKYEKEWRQRMYKNLLRSYFYQKIFYNFLLNHKKITSLGLKFLLKD